MGSKTFDGVWFIAYADDHPPPHVHGRYGEVTVIIDLLADGKVALSHRRDAVRPLNPKRSNVRRILNVANAHALELKELWEKMHGSLS